ncbi:unnamed protein product [Symbiodinium sp. CCMP2592]|nr:unnamed protein product [Symbiodinium sp. CCMP2592]
MAECSLDGLAAEWDAIESLREGLRRGQNLIVEVSEKQVDIKMPKKHKLLLLPILNRMREANKKLPSIEAFRCEVRLLMQLNKRDPTEEDIQKSAWLIRKNCGFIKMKCRRQEDPQVESDEDAYDDDGEDDCSDLASHLSDFQAACEGSEQTDEYADSSDVGMAPLQIVEVPDEGSVPAEDSGPAPVACPPVEAVEVPNENSGPGPCVKVPNENSGPGEKALKEQRIQQIKDRLEILEYQGKGQVTKPLPGNPPSPETFSSKTPEVFTPDKEPLETDPTVDRIAQLKLKQLRKEKDGRGTRGRGGGRGGRGRGRGRGGPSSADAAADGEAAEADYSVEEWMAWYEAPGDYWYETPKKASKREPVTEPESTIKERKSTKNPSKADDPKSDMEPKTNRKRKEPTIEGDVEPKTNRKRKEPTIDGEVEPKTKSKDTKSKPKAKAKAKGRASKNAKSADEAPVAKRKRLPDCAGFSNKRAQAANGEPTFARRYRPATPFKAKRWEAIRNCFRSQIKPQISGSPSLYEDMGYMLYDPFWMYCMTQMQKTKAKIDEDNVVSHVEKCCKKYLQQARAKAKSTRGNKWKEFVLCLLLLIFSYTEDELVQDYDCLEFYAGRARTTAAMRNKSLKAARFDKKYNAPDLRHRSNFMDLLACYFILRGRPENFFVMFAVMCSSFCKMNSGTSKRSKCNSLGYDAYVSVRTSNMLLERSVLLIYLVTGLGGTWFVEQPNQSVLEYYPSFRKMIMDLFNVRGRDAATTQELEDAGLFTGPTTGPEETDAIDVDIDDDEVQAFFGSMTLTVVKAEPSGESPVKGASQPPGDGSAGPIATPARASSAPVPVKIESKLKLTKEQTRQEKLLLAARSRLNRMMKPHTKKKDLEAPEYAKKHWKDVFLQRLEKIVTKKEKYTIKLDEGWYSAAEMKRNCYDDVEEYWASDPVEIPEGSFKGATAYQKSKAAEASLASGSSGASANKDPHIENLDGWVQKLEEQHEACQLVLSQGELNNFNTENAKKYLDKVDKDSTNKRSLWTRYAGKLHARRRFVLRNEWLPTSARKHEKKHLTVLRLRDWLQFLVDKKCWHIVTGLVRRDAARERAILKSFWEKYRCTHEHHPIYEMERQGLLSLERTAGWPKKVIEAEGCVQLLLQHCKDENDFVLQQGVSDGHSGEKFHACILAVTGDWPWLIKSGNLGRSFNHVVKKTKEVADPEGICHLCQAGQRGHSFEHFHTRDPSWLQTFLVQSPFLDPRSPLADLPHPPGAAASNFRYDLWHCCHLGVCKALAGSALALFSETFDGRSKDARFEALSEHYMNWCAQHRRQPLLTKIIKETVSWDNNNTYPYATWYKGSLSTTMCEYIASFTQDAEFEDDLLTKCGEAARAMNAFLSGLYQSDLFLDPTTAKRIGEYGLRFLRRYYSCATQAHQQQRCLFLLLPKFHCVQHICLQDLVLASQKAEWIVNPLCYSVQLAEDYIGRNSRTSRHVHPSTVVQRIAQRHLQAAFTKYVEAQYLVVDDDS